MHVAEMVQSLIDSKGVALACLAAGLTAFAGWRFSSINKARREAGRGLTDKRSLYFFPTSIVTKGAKLKCQLFAGDKLSGQSGLGRGGSGEGVDRAQIRDRPSASVTSDSRLTERFLQLVASCLKASRRGQ